MDIKIISETEECELTLEKMYAVLEQLGHLYFTYTVGSGKFPEWELKRQHPRACMLYSVVLDYACKAREQIKEISETQTKSDGEAANDE